MKHLIEALEQIKNGAEPLNEMQMESWISTARSIANEALSIHDVSKSFFCQHKLVLDCKDQCCKCSNDKKI